MENVRNVMDMRKRQSQIFGFGGNGHLSGGPSDL